MHHKISTTPSLLNEINNLSNRIKSSEIKDPKLRSKALDKIKIVDDKIISKNKELSKILNDIVEKEKNIFTNENFSDYSDRKSDAENLEIRESKIILKDVKDNREYLELREKELAEIKKISGQVLSITNVMSAEVKKQNEGLGIGF